MGFVKDDRARKKLVKAILLICSLTVIASMAVYQFTPARNSDYVEGVIWASESLKAGALLNPDYIYPYAIPFGANIFMLPFVKLFGTSQLANCLGMFLFFGVFLFTGFLFIRSFTDGTASTIMGMAVLLLAYRSGVGENSFHHILYYQLGFICFLGIFAMACRWIFKALEPRYVFGLIAYSAWAGMNGVATMALAFVPACFSLVLIWLFHNKMPSKKIIQCGGILLCGAFVGYVIYRIVMRNITEYGYIDKAGSFAFCSIETWIENARALTKDWLSIFVLSPEDKIIMEIGGIETLLSLALALVMGAVPVYYIIKHNRLTEKTRFVFYGTVMIWIVCLMQYVLLRGALDRLLYNAVLANGVLLAIVVLQNEEKLLSGRIAVLTTGIALAACALTIMFPVHAEWNIDHSITDFLREKGLENGFATYWNAGINTVDSGGAVNVYPIQVNDVGCIKQMKYQCANVWYSSDQAQDGEKRFILLSESEWDAVNNSINSAPTDLAEEKWQHDDYHILTYMPEQWDEIVHQRRVIYNFASMDWQKNCQSTPNSRLILDGGISFGPYIPASEGDTIHVRMSGNGLTHATTDVYEMGNRTGFNIVNMRQSDNTISFDVIIADSFDSVEVIIRNPDNDDYTEAIELTSEEIVVEHPGQ